jgi:hypothetical protein
MITHFDDKGKIFTDVVQKAPVQVTLQLSTQRLHGTLHIHSENRLKEEMNDPEPFLALTQVDVFNFSGSELLFSTNFLAVNKKQIIWIVADTDLKQENPL